MANPFMSADTELITAQNTSTLETFKELAWDFDKSQFIYDADGNHIILTENEALKVWVKKALLVERYRYRAYFDDYGVELEEKLIGKVVNDGSSKEELYQYIKDGLLVNPYILAVHNIGVTQDHKIITMNIELTTVYGDTVIGIEV